MKRNTSLIGNVVLTVCLLGLGYISVATYAIKLGEAHHDIFCRDH